MTASAKQISLHATPGCAQITKRLQPSSPFPLIQALCDSLKEAEPKKTQQEHSCSNHCAVDKRQRCLRKHQDCEYDQRYHKKPYENTLPALNAFLPALIWPADV
jgi:hypothetical protein